MLKRCFVVFIVLTFCVIGYGIVMAEENPIGENLFDNANFEKPSRDLRNLGAADGWGKSPFDGSDRFIEYSIDNDVFYEGSASQKMAGERLDHDAGVRGAVSRYLSDVNPGEVYRFSVWVKIEDFVISPWWHEDEYAEDREEWLESVVEPEREPTAINMRITWADHDHQGLETAGWAFADVEHDGWQKLEIELKVPEDKPYTRQISTARVDLFIFRANATTWWDKFEVVRLQ